MPRGAAMSCCRSSSVGQRAPGGDLQLRLDQIDAGDLLGDGVLDLQAHIGLDEGDRRVVGAVGCVDQKLERAGVEVFRGGGQLRRRLQQPLADRGVQEWRRRDLEDLLALALQAAFALPQMRHRAGAVADDLHLDVTRAREQPLDIDVAVAERGLRLGPAALHGLGQLVGVGDRAHAAPAAAGDRLDHHRRASARARP